MNPAALEALIAQLPKVELHVHLEGSMRPATVVELAARHGVRVSEEEVAARYDYRDFAGFLNAFKWVTSFLRAPADYAFILERFAAELLAQNVVYAEVTLSAGVMLWRKQDWSPILAALDEAADHIEKKGLRLAWIPDATRQFGPQAAMNLVREVARSKTPRVVAFGMGGDELSIPIEGFREVYEFAAEQGLHRVVHAGEVGGPEEVRLAIDALGAERIGHGIAVIHDSFARETVQVFSAVLEICLTSNLKTGALARQLGRPHVTIADHPVRAFRDQGVPFTISTDDPAMFGTTLNEEYHELAQLHFTPEEIVGIAARSAMSSFLPNPERMRLAGRILGTAKRFGLV